MEEPRQDGHRMFVTEEEYAAVYGFCEVCPDHHDMVIFKRDGMPSADGKPRIYPSRHAWNTWRRGEGIFRAIHV
ncbi:MAG: hypothetical protein ACREI5_05355 [Candidatus Methylomirabilales bacterium]